MAGVKGGIFSVSSTVYPADPQLDSNGARGTIAGAHMTPAGTPVFVSFDGKTDHVKLDPTTAAASFALEQPYYTRAFLRLAVAGAADVQLVLEEL